MKPFRLFWMGLVGMALIGILYWGSLFLVGSYINKEYKVGSRIGYFLDKNFPPAPEKEK